MVAARGLVDAQVIPVRNAWYLLLYAWDLARWKDRWQSAAEVAPNLLGLLARVLVDSASDLLRNQMSRAHQVSVREIAGVRGRIDFSTSLKRRSFDSGKAVCVFPELTVDTLRNRILRATLDRLLRDSRVEIGATLDQVQALRHDIRTVLDRMVGVSLINLGTADFNRLQLGRNDAAYELPLALCRLIRRCDIPSEEGGDHVTAALARDDIEFSDLFERFVRNFLKYALPRATVTRENLSWHDEMRSQFMPQMRTDITVDWHDAREIRLVIDTKYYGNTLASGQHNVEKFHSSHLYQLYAYLRTQEDRGDRYRHARGLLLYPTTSLGLNERTKVQGHEIGVSTIDLSLSWPEIERRLLELVRWTSTN